MRDIEFVSDLLIAVMHGPQSGNALTIDEFYRQYEEYETEFPGQSNARRVFNRVLDLIQELLPDIKETRWRNRTDFYSLFVVLSSHMRSPRPSPPIDAMRAALDRFAAHIETLRNDDEGAVRQEVVTYLRSWERGSSDRSRRVDRHEVLESILAEFFVRPRGRSVDARPTQ